MAITLRFDESWHGATSPISLQYITPFQGVTLRFYKLQQINQSPIYLHFGDFDGEVLRFDEPWKASQSPIYLRFDGSQQPSAEPVPQVLGIAVGIRWAAVAAIEQQLILSEHASRIDDRVTNRWHGDTTQARDAVAWESKNAVQYNAIQSWTVKTAILRRSSVRWSLPDSHRIGTAQGWYTGPSRRDDTATTWHNRKAAEQRPVQPFILGSHQHIHHQLAWHGPAVRAGEHIKWGFPAPRWICTDAYQPPEPGLLTIRFDNAPPPSDGAIVIRFDSNPRVCHLDNGGGYIPSNPPLPPIDFNVPITPQIRRSYLMTPQISCIRLSDNLPIVLRSVSIQQSRSQWAATCTLVFSSKGDADRAAGEAVMVTVNGYEFYLLIEAPNSSASFGSRTYSATGRGLLAELAAPYKKAVNFVNQVDRSFMGLASDIVANTGWSVATSMTDYTVPATAWSYAGKTPAEALNMMASAIGAMLDVDAATKTITFIPKWPVSPWNTATASPDVALHDAVILEHSERLEMRTAANAVLVRGEQIGVARKVRRTGSAGDEFADDVLEKLITDSQAARMRGTHELAEAGDKVQSQLRTKVMADLPPVRPGMLVGVTFDGTTYKAVCDSWQLTAQTNNVGQTTVNQSLTLLRNAS